MSEASEAGQADWEAAYEQGAPEFVDLIRQVHDPEVLAGLANRWSRDDRAPARALLCAYFEAPLNAFRHEVLVKRLLKAAEAAEDDEAIAWMTRALDCSVERRVQLARRTESAIVATQEEARKLAIDWTRGGERVTRTWQVGPDQHLVLARGLEPGLAAPHGSRMPTESSRTAYVLDGRTKRYVRTTVPEWVQKLGLTDQVAPDGSLPEPGLYSQELEQFRLYSVATRHHLRRRLWRYFRKLGKLDPARYTRTIAQAIVLYQDEDLENRINLLDRWCLVHALFGAHPALEARSNGWAFREHLNETELEPFPAFAEHWKSAAETLAWIAESARSRLVRHWALALFQRQCETLGVAPGAEQLVGWLTHPDPLVVESGVNWLPASTGLDQLSLSQWRVSINSVPHEQVARLAPLIEAQIDQRELSLDDAVELARMSPEPLASRGWQVITAGTVEPHALPLLASVGLSECASVRTEALGWLQDRLSGGAVSEADWLYEWLASDHAETRSAALNWLRSRPGLCENPQVWERIVQDLRTENLPALVELLAGERAGDGVRHVELLAVVPLEGLIPIWQRVIETDHLGSHKLTERVMAQVQRRVAVRPQDAESMIPLLARAVQSTAQRILRLAIAGLARIRTVRPDLAGQIDTVLPELQWIG